MAQNNQTQDLINFLIDSLRNYSYNNGYTTSYSTPTSSYSTYTSDDDYDIKKQKRRFYEEELHQDILDARQRNRFLEAYKKEKELHQLRLENLRIQLKEAEDAGDLEKRNKLIHDINMEERRFASATYGKNNVTETVKSIEKLVEGVKRAYGVVQKLTKPWADADHAASKFTKTIGGTKKAMDALTRDSLKGVSKSIGLKFDLSSQELIEAQQNYLKGIGRNINVDNVAKESMAAITRISQDAGIDGLDLAAQFENFGVSIEKTGDHLGEMFSDASKYGISFQKYADSVAKNIKIAQNYTFKNGLKGLESMAKKATAMKLDMQQVANFADKVSTVEGALETSARLQVLGGPFASLSDPMGMLYEGLNDMEGLQDRVIKMVRGLGTYNKETGEIIVSSYNKQRVKAAAEAMGMDYSQLMESVNAQARREEIDKQIKSSSKVAKFDEDFQELIRNTGVIKNGKAGITIDGKFKTLDELDPKKDRETLIAMTRSESQDIKQIAIDLRSLVQKRSGLGKAYDAVQGRMFSWLGKGESALLGMLGGGLTTAALYGAVGLNNIGILGSIASGWSKLFRGGKSPKLPAGTKLNSAGRLINAKTGRFVSTKATSKVATKAATQGLGKSILSGAGAGAGGGLKALLGTTGGGIAAGGLVAGIGLLGNHFTNKAVADGKMKAGSNSHKAAKMASQAATFGGIGMAIGSAIAPGIGTAIVGTLGAAVGAFIGHQQAQKAKNADILDNRLKELGITRKGDYGARKLRKYEKALETGELSDRLRRRLLQEGDTDILKAIESKKEALEKKELEKKKIKNQNKLRFGTANISVGVAKFGGMGFNPIFGLAGLATKTAGAIIKGKEEKGLKTSFDKMKDKTVTNTNNTTTPSHTFDININGSLKLTGDNGQSVDIIDELRRHPDIMRKLAVELARQIGSNVNGGDIIGAM